MTIMNQRILVTGSSGLVGTSLRSALAAKGVDLVCLDTRASGREFGDVRDRNRMRQLTADVDGIVHLAAISRVIWGEQNPDLCWKTNVGGLRNALDAAADSTRKPWLIFASSREVYGQPERLPATEDTPLKPVNIYGRAKVEGERLVNEAASSGIRACTIRLSNVFGSTSDHTDRVVPAFARAAALGEDMRVDGLDHTFDFTHIDDVTRGVVALTELLAAGGAAPPPIHFVSGKPTTLGELANLSARLGQSGSVIRSAAPRDFDVARFVGDASRAKKLLGWQPEVKLENGLARLIQGFRETHGTVETPEAV